MRQNILSAEDWLKDEAVSSGLPLFPVSGKDVTLIKFSHLELFIIADVSPGDVAQKRVACRARLRFLTLQRGCPLFDLVPEPTLLRLDGVALPTSKLPLVSPENKEAELRLLDVVLEPHTEHTLDIEYDIKSNVLFTSGGVRLGFFMTDGKPRGFLERYAPANLEFDQFPMSLDLRINGATNAHRLFTNGDAVQSGNRWNVTFPGYFTCSSFYLHLTDRTMTVIAGAYQGIAPNPIPVTVYGEDSSKVNDAMRQALVFLRELESLYGPYAHKSLVIYLTEDLRAGNGMEYCGATMTTLGALEHELIHMWFARGVMPADGNAGWIDEAIARWHERGRPEIAPNPRRQPVNLAGFSSFRRHTLLDSAYENGVRLLKELNFMFRDNGGLQPILKKLFLAKRRQLITTPFFESFLETESGLDLTQMFDRFVYGRKDPSLLTLEEEIEARILTTELLNAALEEQRRRPAHTPYTLEELQQLV